MGPTITQGDSTDPLEAVKPVHALLTQKYFVDALYENIFVRRGVYRLLAGAVDWVDRNVVDSLVDLIGIVFRNSGRALAQAQTGQVQLYGVALVLGSLLILLGFLISAL